MGEKKTRDGLRLTDIARVATEIGARLREGTNHPYILNYKGLRACPLAASTNAERMVAPWLAHASGKSKLEAYQAMKRGYW